MDEKKKKQMAKMVDAVQPSCDDKIIAAMTCSHAGSMSSLLISKFTGGGGGLSKTSSLPNPVFIAVGTNTVYAFMQKGRPETTERRVFLQHGNRRPGTAVSAPTITAAVVRTIRRAGVDSPLGGAYVFRHTVAGRLVKRGAPLKEHAPHLRRAQTPALV